MKQLIRTALGLALTLGLIGVASLSGPLVERAAATPVATSATASAGSGKVVATSSKLAKRCKTKGRVLCIDKSKRKLYYVNKGKIIKTTDARFGCSSTPTRNGTFHVYRKNRHWVSTIYHSSMPFSMFFSGGQAVHYSSDFAARGYYGCSHGCVNLRSWSTIKWIYKHIKVGDKVVVYWS